MTAAADSVITFAITRRLTWLAWVSNLAGVMVTFVAAGFLLEVFISDRETDSLARENLPFILPYVLLAGVGASIYLNRQQAKAFDWFANGREPTEAEHQLVLRQPLIIAVTTALVWGVGGVIGFFLNLDHGLGTAALIAVTFWFGGETTAALAYATCERNIRPVTARALSAREPRRSSAPGVRDRLLVAWSLGTAVPVGGVLVVSIAGLTRDGASIEAVAGAGAFLGAVAFAMGLLMTAVTARSIVEPLNEIRRGVERVGTGDLGVEVPINDASEVGLLQAGFNRMAEGLRERERIRDLFGRQVGEEVAQAALREGTRLGGEEREVGALFVDLTGSTSLSLAMPPTEVVRLLNKFFRVIVEAVREEGGWVNKFEGDAALCVFGAPVSTGDPAGSALCAARKLADRLQREVPEVGFGIGVSAGRAVAGNVGSEQRFEYTVIGDPVNEAARLSDLAKDRGVPVIASDAALDRATERECNEWDVSERAVLRGRLEATGLALPKA